MSGTAASDGSTTEDYSEVQCNLKTMSVQQRAVLVEERQTTLHGRVRAADDK